MITAVLMTMLAGVLMVMFGYDGVSDDGDKYFNNYVGSECDHDGNADDEVEADDT